MPTKTFQTIAGAGIGSAVAAAAALPAVAQPWEAIDNTPRNDSILVEISSHRGSCQGLLINPTTAVVGPGCVTAGITGVVRTTTGTGDSATFTVSTPFPGIDFGLLHLSRSLLDPELTPPNSPVPPAPMPTPPVDDGRGPDVGTNVR